MSTRSHIAFYESEPTAELKKPDCLLYRHSDGYPTGVLPELIPAVVHMKGRWNDTEYLSARVLQILCNSYDADLAEYDVAAGKDMSGLKRVHETGYGICYDKKPHGDHEYYYAVYNNGTIEVYSCGYDSKLKDYKKIGFVDLKSLTTLTMSPDDINALAEAMEEPEAENLPL